MRLSSRIGVGFVAVSVCLLLAPWMTVNARARAIPSELRPEFRSTFVVSQEQAPAKPKKVNAQLPDGDGKDVVVKHCTMCHTADTFAGRRYDKDHWSQIIDNMTSKGMEATDPEIDTILAYLSTNLGPTSPAAEPAAPKPAAPNR